MAVELGEVPTNVQKAATLCMATIRIRYEQEPSQRSGAEAPSKESAMQLQSAPV